MSKDIIIISTADWSNPFWTNKQHMATMFAKRGFRVLFVESLGLRRPTANKRDFRRILNRFIKGIKGIQMVRENIWVFSPLIIPYHQFPLIRSINRKILSKMIRYYLSCLNFTNPIFWTYNPLIMENLQALNISLKVYHCVDDLTSTPGISSNILDSAERQCITSSDLIFTTSRKLEERCVKLNPKNTYYFPNVVDYDHFNMAITKGPIPDDLSKIPAPRIGFIGALSEYKVDFDLIYEIAVKKPEWHWVLIGEIGEGQPGTKVVKLKLPNIHFLGPREYQTLPAYLRGIDVATLPSSLNPYTASMFPMKFFEYLAAGKSVVATDLPALREFSKAYMVAKSPGEFISAIENCLIEKGPDRVFGMNLAKNYTWNSRMDKMIEALIEKWAEKTNL